VVGASGALEVSLLVQKLTASGCAKPDAPAAATPSESTRKRFLFASTANWYCLRLPTHRGWPCPSGRNTPMNTWFRKVPWVLTLTGSEAEAKTLLIEAICVRTSVKAAIRPYRSPPTE